MRKLGFTALALGAALTLSLGLSVPQASADVETEAPATTEAPAAEVAEVPGNTNTAVSVIGVSGDTLELSVTTGTKEVLVGTASVKGSAGKKVLKVSTWDTYVVPTAKSGLSHSYVDVDLSKLAIKKDNYLCIKADQQTDDEALNVVIPASKTNLKVTYKKADGSLEFKAGTENYKGGLSFRTANSSYAGYVAVDNGAIVTDDEDTEFNVETYRMTGATLYFYEDTASEEGSATPTAEMTVGTEKIHASNGTDVVGAVTTNARKSKEAKVNISKLATAPKVTANYVSGKITVPKNAAYRIIKKADTSALATFAPASSTTVTLTVASDTDALTADDDFAIDVQTQKSGSLASKIGHYTFSKLEATDTSDVTPASPVVTTPKPGKSTPATSQSIEYTNNSETNTYKISFYESGKTPGTDRAKSSITLKPKAAGSTKNVATLKKIPLDATITIARVGDSKNKVWAGTEVTFDGSAAADGSSTIITPAKQKYKITIDEDADFSSMTVDNEAVEVSAGESVDVLEGATVVITASKKTDCLTFEGITLDDSNKTITGTDKTVYTFEMPSSAISIK